MAALKHEGLVLQSIKQPRRYELADTEKFKTEMKALMGVSKKSKPTKGYIDPPCCDHAAPTFDPPVDLEEPIKTTA
jgi:hypothetical protein